MTDQQSGKRRYFYGKTRTEAVAKLKEAFSSAARGLPAVPEKQLTADYLQTWLEGRKTALRPTTYRSYEQLIRVHIVPEIGRVPLGKLSSARIQNFLNEKLQSGLSARTVRYLHAIIRRALNQAVRWNMIPRNVALFVDLPKQESERPVPYDLDEARSFLRAVQGHYLEALFVLAITTGLRQGELLGLRWSDIDMRAGMVHVEGQLQRVDKELTWVPTKTERSRRKIHLSPVALESLQQHQEQSEGQGYVFTSSSGRPLIARNVYRSFQRLLQQAGLRQIRFHDLRHSAATIMLSQGVDLRTIMEVLGHSQISLTMNTYSNVLPSLKDDAATKMENALRPVESTAAL